MVLHAKAVLIAWALVMVVAGLYGSGIDQRLSNDGLKVIGSESQQAANVMESNFPRLRGTPLFVVLTREDRRSDSEAVRVRASRRDALTERRVVRVLSALPDGGTVSVGRGAAAFNASRTVETRATLITTRLRMGAEEAQKALTGIEAAIRPLEAGGRSVRVLGVPVVARRYTEIATRDVNRAERLALVVTCGALVVAFMSLVTALLPVALAIATLLVTLGFLSLLSHAMSLSIVSVNTVSVLALGLSIDYSLFFVTRYREELPAGSSGAAIGRTMATTGRAIVLSGASIAMAMLTLLAIGIDEFSSMATSAAIATGIAVAAALTLLPALITALGANVDRLAVRRPPAPSPSSAWARLASIVVSRPLAAVAISTCVLVALAIPALSVERRFHPLGDLPPGDELVTDVAEATRLFGPGAVAPVEVATKDERYVTRVLGADPNVSSANAAAREGRWAVVRAFLKSPAESSASLRSIERLRERTRDRPEPSYVGGLTAAAIDLTDRIEARTPTVVLAAMLAAFVALSLGLRSFVIPLKAVLGTLLSVAAALGLLAMLFPSDAASGSGELLIPITIFAIVFGLSIDYEVFLLHRAREAVLRGATTEAAVATALTRSGRPITLAGVCLATVFAALAGSSLESFRQLGAGVACAVLLDVTVVRCVLIPAATVLLGRWNWWFPAGDGRLGGAPSQSTPPSPADPP